LTHFAGIPVDTDKICPAGLVTHIFLTDLKRTTVLHVCITQSWGVFLVDFVYFCHTKKGLIMFWSRITQTHIYSQINFFDMNYLVTKKVVETSEMH